MAGGNNLWYIPQLIVETTVEVVRGFVIVFVYTLIGAVKALLPCGWLPRKSVAGDIVLITGAGSGLGRLLAQRFAALGSRLILWDINEQGNEETAELVKKLGADVHTYTVDLSSRVDIQLAAERVKKEIGDVDILINNAGVVTGKQFLECPDYLMEKTLEVNTGALFWTVKSFLGKMMEKNHGHVVTIASAAGLFGTNGLADYCASKFAAVGFSESLALEIKAARASDVHISVVCPYFINTGMFEGVSTLWPNLIPILEPEYVVDRTMETILTNNPVLVMPRFVYFVYFAKGFLPIKAQLFLGDFFGVTKSMAFFKGRASSSA